MNEPIQLNEALKQKAETFIVSFLPSRQQK